MEKLKLSLMTAAFALMTGGLASAQTTLQTLDDTTILGNRAATFADTSDAEDNFGGRTELIVGTLGNARTLLLRFDVSGLADEINNPNRRVASATLVLNDRTGRSNPNSGDEFAAYGVLPENAGWIEGTNASSGTGPTGEMGSVSQLFRVTPSSQTADGGPDDDGFFWHSDGGGASLALTVENFPEGPPNGFTVGVDGDNPTDTGPQLGVAAFNAPDSNGDYMVNLDAQGLNSLLPAWLASPTENAGLALAAVAGPLGQAGNQYFFESDEGTPADRPELVLTFEDGAFARRGDFDGDGDVDIDDLDRYIGNLDQPAVGALADIDLNGDGTIDDADFSEHYGQLVETSNGQVGTFQGDLNLDGEVDVFGDGFVFLANIGSAATSWADGDFNADGQVDIFGDGFALLNNIGNNNGSGGAAPATSAVPEPGSFSLLALVGLSAVAQRRR